MDSLGPEAIHALMRRHAAGDRSPELMDALDRAAFAFFHAPWETRPAPGEPSAKPRHLPTGGSLPLLPLDDELGPTTQEPEPESRGSGGSGPVASLATGLGALGLHAFVLEDRAVQVNLVLDPETDCTCLLQFALRPEDQTIKVRARSDMMYSLSQEPLLPRIRTRWNQEESKPRAVLRSTHEGGRLRLELAASLPLGLLDDPEDTASALRALVAQVQAFWRFVRLGLTRKPLS